MNLATILAKIKALRPLFHKTFFAVLIIKLVSSSFFGYDFVTKGFIPFIQFFSQDFQNPYEYFSNLTVAPFPYPAGMLLFAGLPYIIAGWFLPETWMQIPTLNLLLIRVPLLIFDCLIYIALCLLLPTKEKKVFWLYYASPILFYISFIYGQLDVIPVAFLILSLLFLTKKHLIFSFLFLGVGITTKTALLGVLPFYLIYLYKNEFKITSILKLLVIPISIFILLNSSFFSKIFINTIFNNPEQARLFSLMVTFQSSNMSFLIAPAALLLILYKFSTYKRLNTDSLFLVIGLTYTILVALVPPMPGWFYWSIPFLIFFSIKYKGAPMMVFVALNTFFILYYLPNNNLDLTKNIIFTGLELSLIILAVWSYKIGTKTTELVQKTKDRFLMAIAGDSGVGKSTLATTLEKAFGSHQVVMMNGDDLHKWERSDPHWQTMTHLNPKSNKIHTDYEHLTSLLRGESIERYAYDHNKGTFIGPFKINPNRIIMLQGLMPFLLDSVRHLSHLKIYVEAEENLRIKWKISRDELLRGHKTDFIYSQIEERKPDALKFIHPQKDFADWIIRYSEKADGQVQVEYIIKNSIGNDLLIEELEKVPSLSIKHSYYDINFQSISIFGDIIEDKILEIAYKLYPNLYDLLDHNPNFEDGIGGVHQLFLINYLSHFYKFKNAPLS